ncbi:MAG TPA: hypothetical protein VKF36_06475 [Syntrophorhabdales bacterium]|nr:hypothetical protein [Syntrophorhabdales bacterium]
MTTDSVQPCVVITHWIHTEVLELLSHSFRVIPNMTREPLPRGEVLKRAREADALIIGMPDVIDCLFVNACPRLKIIAGTFERSENVDVEACTENRIWFTSIQHEPLSTPHPADAGDEVRRAITLEAVACIFEALNGERPKGAVNDPLR